MSGFWKIVFAVMAGGLILLIALDFSGALPGLDRDNMAGLLYLGVLGAVIAAGIVGSRGYRLGDTARSLALWAVIIFALVVGYQHRYDLQDIASRLTGGMIFTGQAPG